MNNNENINSVHVVIIGHELAEDTSIHSIYSNRSAAVKACKELQSSLGDDMIVSVEEHELFDE